MTRANLASDGSILNELYTAQDWPLPNVTVTIGSVSARTERKWTVQPPQRHGAITPLFGFKSDTIRINNHKFPPSRQYQLFIDFSMSQQPPPIRSRSRLSQAQGQGPGEGAGQGPARVQAKARPRHRSAADNRGKSQAHRLLQVT